MIIVGMGLTGEVDGCTDLLENFIICDIAITILPCLEFNRSRCINLLTIQEMYSNPNVERRSCTIIVLYLTKTIYMCIHLRLAENDIAITL